MTPIPPVVLFADRDLASTRPLRQELRRRGARALMAETLPQALRAAELFHPELVVLSDDLGGPQPYALVEQLQSLLPRAEIILLAAEPSNIPEGVGLGLLFAAPKPVARATLLDVIESAFPGRLPAGAATPAPCTVLCVDDDRAYLESIRRVLARHGCRVSAFDDPRGALGALGRLAPDLALLDIRMPGMDGRELAREIRRETGGLVPIVMLSAFSTGADMAAAYAHGADYYLTKPCEPRQLLDVVDYYSGDLDSEERELLQARL